MKTPCLKYGHRGAKGYVTENTLDSIEKAIELDVDGIEIDVHVCKSGELVVFHDFTLERLTNGTGNISEKTLKMLNTLVVNDKYNIPTLKQVINLVKNRCKINIELKGNKTAIKTVKLIETYVNLGICTYNDFIISSFKKEELLSVWQLTKKIHLGVLTEGKVSNALQFAKTINAYSIHPNYTLLTPEAVDLAHNNGFYVYTWTVNTTANIKRLKRYGVDAIISDYPDRI